MDGLTEGDVFALLTDLRDGLARDGYALEVVSVLPQIELAILAGEGACEDCLVGKDLMKRYVIAALNEMSPGIGPDDITVSYPNEHGVAA